MHDQQLRTCRRTGCRWPAAASLSYRYATRQVWLVDLRPAPDPALYDLCPDHADTLTVPRGWDRVDERSVPAPRAEPAGRDLVPAGPDPRPPPAHAAPERAANRYEQLSRELPRVAAELAGRPHDRREERPAPVPSRDLAPIPVADDGAEAVVVALETAGAHRRR